jgi:S-DNA-T family DNA segregation ATPase FtsK/SpoIIIE
MPHLLIAGTTGSGKSGCINAILTSVLLRSTPDEVRMILVDPKRIELNHYESIPHLLTPVVSSPKGAAAVLANVVGEMERRYERMSIVRARNLPEANRALRARGEDALPYLLVVIDELADLMMISPHEVEEAVIRLAQKSRAVGVHLVLATQRPSVDVITGMIKANVPSRIAFAVSSQTDSRVILDQSGAESLLGQGDMLFKPLGTSRLQRVQGAFVSEEEIALVVEQCRHQREQELDEGYLELPEAFEEGAEPGEDEFDPDEDALLEKAIEIVVQTQTASVSLLQRRLRVGYTRAGRLIDMLERRGIISGYEGSKPRRVLVGEGDLHRVLATD